MLTLQFSWLKCRYVHVSNRIYNLVNVSRSECVKRDGVIRSFLNGWCWNEHPNIVLHRKLLSANHCTEWMKYSKRYPYVIDYDYTLYHEGFIHRGTFVFSDADNNQLLLVEGVSISSDQLRNGGSSKTRQKARNRKRKTLRDKLHTLAQLIHHCNVKKTEGVIVTDNDIEHCITLPDNVGNSWMQLCISEDALSSDATWRQSYWPRDTSYATCIERDKILRTYLTSCDWSSDPEFNIIRHLLVNPDKCYIEKYPLFYDYQYIVPLDNGAVCEGDCLFTDGKNNFMAVEVKSLLPGELHNPNRLGKTARKARHIKRRIVEHQAKFYAKNWQKFNPQVARTEGVVATEDGLQHVTTFDQH